MSARPLPLAPPPSPRANRLALELMVTLALTPMIICGASVLEARLSGSAGWSSSVGALVFVVGPCLFGVGLLFLTRSGWAAWTTWSIELALFLFLCLGDAFSGHHLTARMGLTLLVMPLLAWRIRVLDGALKAS